jgi:hypothetical protein
MYLYIWPKTHGIDEVATHLNMVWSPNFRVWDWSPLVRFCLPLIGCCHWLNATCASSPTMPVILWSKFISGLTSDERSEARRRRLGLKRPPPSCILLNRMVWQRGWTGPSSPKLVGCCPMLVCIDIFLGWTLHCLLLDEHVILHFVW